MGCSSSSVPEPPQHMPPQPPAWKGPKPTQVYRPSIQQSAYAQPICEQPGCVVQQIEGPDAAFLDTMSPSGVTWARHVASGEIRVGPITGFLDGPWAECIASAVVFEHRHNWRRMPEYESEGPVGGVLKALETALQGRRQREELVEAAHRLEEAARAAVQQGRCVPKLASGAAGLQKPEPGQASPAGMQHAPWQRQHAEAAAGLQPMHGQLLHAPHMYPEPSPPERYAPGQDTHGQPACGPQTAWGRPAHSLAACGQQTLVQPVCSEPAPAPSGGMSTGAKVALAAGGALAVGGLAGAGFAAAGGMDHTSGDAGEAIMAAGQDIGGWDGGALGDVEEVLEDIF